MPAFVVSAFYVVPRCPPTDGRVSSHPPKLFLGQRAPWRYLLRSSASSSQLSTSMSVSFRSRLQMLLKRSVERPFGRCPVVSSPYRTSLIGDHPLFGAHVPAISVYADTKVDACSGSRPAPPCWYWRLLSPCDAKDSSHVGSEGENSLDASFAWHRLSMIRCRSAGYGGHTSSTP